MALLIKGEGVGAPETWTALGVSQEGPGMWQMDVAMMQVTSVRTRVCVRVCV
jgi:hypothetical protein